MIPTGSPQSPFLRVAVDHRELRSPVVEALKQLPGIQLEFEQLEIGDYVVDQSCVFERKTVLDFARSIADGRLFIQAQKLASLPGPAAIILEGRASDLAATNMRREALQGAMISLSLIFRLPVLRALDATETARLMIYAAQQIRRQEWMGGGRYGRRGETQAEDPTENSSRTSWRGADKGRATAGKIWQRGSGHDCELGGFGTGRGSRREDCRGHPRSITGSTSSLRVSLSECPFRPSGALIFFRRDP